MPLVGRNKSGKHLNPNSAHSRVFISYTYEDKNKVSFFKNQRKTSKSLDFTDYSIKEPYKINWKGSAKYRIKNSDSVVVLVGENTHKSKSVKYEMKMAKKYNKTIIPFRSSPKITTKKINGKNVHDWNCEKIQKTIDASKKKRF